MTTSTANSPRRSLVVMLGAVLCAGGATAVVLFFFQPWRSCEGEDTSVGCAMLPGDAAMMQLSGLVFLIGVIVVASGLLSRPAERR